jgi:hypothetical protein
MCLNNQNNHSKLRFRNLTLKASQNHQNLHRAPNSNNLCKVNLPETWYLTVISCLRINLSLLSSIFVPAAPICHFFSFDNFPFISNDQLIFPVWFTTIKKKNWMKKWRTQPRQRVETRIASTFLSSRQWKT